MDSILPQPQKPAKEEHKSSPKFSLDLPPEPAQGKPKKSRRALWIVILAVFLVIITFCIGAVLWYNSALKPYSDDTTQIEIDVATGSSPSEVADELAQNHLIKSSLAMKVYMKFSGKSSVQAGTYFFSASQPVSEIVTWLNEGLTQQRKITILPGLTIKEIRQEFIDYGFSADAVDEALNKTYDHPLLAEKPASANLEGYIYPETYYVEASATPEDVILTTFDEFESLIEENNLRQQLADRGFNLYQGITLASIVVKEASDTQDQYQVAQVFETRLAQNMVLGSDVTYQYAAELLGVEPSTTLDYPYNTRIYSGLPPGPIANFYIATLEAVANPASGSYLYFVAGDDGTIHYSNTLEEHEQNIELYCKVLCSGA